MTKILQSKQQFMLLNKMPWKFTHQQTSSKVKAEYARLCSKSQHVQGIKSDCLTRHEEGMHTLA